MSAPSSSANTRVVLNAFEKYQKERLTFVQTVAEHASREANVEVLQSAGIMSLLRPLLLDSVPAIQQAAALALGRLANYNEDLAAAVVDGDILPQLVYSLREQNRFYKKAAAFVLRAVAKHSPELAQAVVDSKALSALLACLEEFDPGVKETAAWAVGYIARHSASLATAVVDAGALPLLVLCVQEPELSLRRIATSALADIAKHSPELAAAAVEAHAVAFTAPLLGSPDAKLRRQVAGLLAHVAKHSVELAETVVDADAFPAALRCLRDNDPHVRRNAATLVCELAKHTSELAQLVVNSGGLAAVVDYVTGSLGPSRLAGVMTLGYIAAFSETLALSVIVSKGVAPLADALTTETDDHVRAACAWALGQVGRHSPDHARTLADHAVLSKLLTVLLEVGGTAEHDRDASPSPGGRDAGETTLTADLRTKTKRALKCILEKTLSLDALEPLLQSDTPASILKHVLAQFAKVLPHDVAARRAFVTSGGLQRVQEIVAAINQLPGDLRGSRIGESIQKINDCYPDEIVRYYSPGYCATLLDKISEHPVPHGGVGHSSVPGMEPNVQAKDSGNMQSESMQGGSQSTTVGM